MIIFRVWLILGLGVAQCERTMAIQCQQERGCSADLPHFAHTFPRVYWCDF